MKSHHYKATIAWTGNNGSGTGDYKGYSRSHTISIDGKATLEASSDSAFRGDASKHTPEDLFVAALSSCHMLWYLHLCAVNGVVVVTYTDNAEGEMIENNDGSGQFSSVTLHPYVTVADATMTEKAQSLHAEANRMCFIARSVNFPVHHQAEASVVRRES